MLSRCPNEHFGWNLVSKLSKLLKRYHQTDNALPYALADYNAGRGNVLRLVLRAALAQLGLGLAIGIPAALAGGSLLAHQLYGVKSYDPMIVGAAALVLAACAIVAASVPAQRATYVDPIVALRYE